MANYRQPNKFKVLNGDTYNSYPTKIRVYQRVPNRLNFRIIVPAEGVFETKVRIKVASEDSNKTLRFSRKFVSFEYMQEHCWIPEIIEIASETQVAVYKIFWKREHKGNFIALYQNKEYGIDYPKELNGQPYQMKLE